jgi:hypothetical protein
MSYWVYLEKEGKTVEVENHSEGGTYAVGGINEAELNVTYNYSKHYSVKNLDGRVAKDTVEEIEAKINEFGVGRDPDYWNPTKGNVGYMLSILLKWAKQNPDAIWRIS